MASEMVRSPTVIKSLLQLESTIRKDMGVVWGKNATREKGDAHISYNTSTVCKCELEFGCC